jgi:hypothetical protein
MKCHAVINSIFIFFLLSSLGSCDEPSVTPTQFPKFWKHSSESLWDSTSTANNLLGIWKLTHRYCCPESTTVGKLSNVKHELYFLSISPDSIRVYESGELIRESYWLLQSQSTSSVPDQSTSVFRMTTDPHVSNTWGQIIFGENLLLFYGSPSDGPDNYFERVLDRAEM